MISGGRGKVNGNKVEASKTDVSVCAKIYDNCTTIYWKVRLVGTGIPSSVVVTWTRLHPWKKLGVCHITSHNCQAAHYRRDF